MFNLVSLIIGSVALVFAVIAFLPLLGWANWLIIPLAIIGAVIHGGQEDPLVRAFGEKPRALQPLSGNHDFKVGRQIQAETLAAGHCHFMRCQLQWLVINDRLVFGYCRLFERTPVIGFSAIVIATGRILRG